ncbi:MAG: IclR family transcriptional regulator [Nocardioidaceae bacterium]
MRDDVGQPDRRRLEVTVNPEPTLIMSVQRALRLLEAMGEHSCGAPAKVLAREVALPLATTYHLLRTLVHDGYVRKLPDGTFVLGDGVDALARRDNPQAALRRARPVMTSLRDKLSAATYLSMYVDGEIKVLQIVDGPRTPRVDLWVGPSDAGHATALGKCILRQLPADALSDYLARHPLEDLTPRTLTRQSSLRRELIHGVGPLVVDHEEYTLGTTCAAVPVSDGEFVGSLAMSTGTNRVQNLRHLAPTLVSAATKVRKALSLSI